MNIGKKVFKFRMLFVYLIGFVCSFYIAYFLGGVTYLSPYIDGDITPVFILCLFCYYVFGFIIMAIMTDSIYRASYLIHTTLLGGVILFFLYLIPFKTTFTNEISDIAYQGILKKMNLSKDKNEISHTNKDIDEIYEAYNNKDISKLDYFYSKINDIKQIEADIFAQVIVNVRVLNNKKITYFYNEILEDKRISINEYNELVKLIVNEEVK